MPLTESQQALLTKMRMDNQLAGFPFSPTEFWVGEIQNFNQALDVFGINDVEDEYYNTRFSGVTPQDSRLFLWFMWLYYQALKQRDVFNLFDKLSATIADAPKYVPAINGNPLPLSTAIEFDGKRLSPDLLFSIDDFYNLYELEPRIATDALVVADLGSGWGRIGYLLNQINRNITYVAFDIPESLIISSTYLPRLLPEASVVDYLGGQHFSSLNRSIFKKADLWFLGTQDLNKVERGAIDVFINVASFQEMTLAQVNAYLQLVDKTVEGGVIYTRNAWVHTPPNSATFHDYVVPTHWVKTYLRTARHSPLFYEFGAKVSAPRNRNDE